MELTIRMLRNLAKLRFKIVVMTRPQPICEYGWLKANRPMPKKRNTICSAETAIVS